MTEFGKTDYIPFETFSQIGYNCVIYPVSTLRIAMKAIERFVDDLNINGTVESNLENMQTRKELSPKKTFEVSLPHGNSVSRATT